MLGICFHFLLDYGNISFLVFWGAELGYKAVTKIGHGNWRGGVYSLVIRVEKDVLPGCEFLFSV